jgi:hypothetical protein
MKKIYSLCDFCHKAKPKEDLEVITVVYRKCKNCNPDVMDKGGAENIREDLMTRKPVRVVRKIPPAFIRDAFRPPEADIPMTEGDKILKVETENKTKESNGGTDSTTV